MTEHRALRAPSTEHRAYVLGINSRELCYGATCAGATGTVKTHPSGARAMTPGLADLISAYRVSHP